MPHIVTVHATGLCKEVHRPVIGELAQLEASGWVTSIDQRAHGDSDVPPPPYSWWDIARDLLVVLDGAEGTVGFGHSSGAAALVLAELLAPGTFAAMVLVEPIILPPGIEFDDDHPVVRSALRRKAAFADRSAAAANFAGKEPFIGWRPDALDAYLDHGLTPGPDGARLKCPPDAEAEFYRGATRHLGWDRLGEVGCPVVLVAGERSNSHDRPFLDRQASRFGNIDHVEVVAGASHFVVQERPEVMAQILAGTIARHHHR